MLVLALSCSKSTSNENVSNNPSPAVTSGTPEDSSVVLSIPVGEGGVSFENTDVEELEPWGPSAFTIGPDGTYFVVDAVNNKILRFRPDGGQMSPIVVEGVAGISDITVTNDDIYVLDQFAMSPAIFRLKTDGTFQEKTSLLPQPGAGLRGARSLSTVRGVATATDGAVLLEFESTTALRRLDDDSRALDRSMRGKNYSVKVPTLQNQVSEGGRGFVLLDGQPFAEIKVDNFIAEMKTVSVNAAGDLFVVVDEIAATPLVDVDETVRRYSHEGNLLGMARVPIRELRSYNMSETVQPDPNGEIVACDNRKKRPTLDFVTLAFETHLEPILPTYTPSQISLTSPASCRTRDQMVAMASKYRRNTVVLNVTNTDGDCEGRRKPHYIAGAGEYSSVAYDWGGFDTVETYNQLMSENKMAGDITSVGEAPCSRGVDCSGFVLRCWGFTDRSGLSTATLPNISTEVSILQLLPGDILNRPGDHVILFDKSDGKGVWAWEATTGGFDRVIYRSTRWRRWLGYTARRYKQVC